MTTKKIGFACIWSENHPKKGVISTEGLNVGGTTITYLNKLSVERAEQKLYDIMVSNIGAVGKLVQKVAEQEPSLRMVRLSSDVMTGYTHDKWAYFYKTPDVIRKMEELFAPIGEFAREHNVRLSFHPGQFTVLASDREEVVRQSIDEFEYHTDMARMMGYGKKFQDFKINVHIAGKRGPEGIRQVHGKLSPEARNCITIENEEISYGLDDCLTISDIVPIVLDVHHHFIREGEYIQFNDDRIKRVNASWRGIRPTFHYSQCREDYLSDCPSDVLPDMKLLLQRGYKKQKLRAHSDFMWNMTVNEWALTHLEWGDCMVEAKAKNLASFQLYEFWKSFKK